MGKITFKKYVPSSLFRGITSSFAGSIQTMIFFSILTCTIGSQGGPNKMAAANFLWLQFLSNRSSIQSFFFFLRSVEYYNSTMSVLAIGHFRIALGLSFKTSLSAKSLLWISVSIHIEIRTNYNDKNLALRLALKERLTGTRKWTI